MPAVNYLWDPVEDNVVKEFDDEGATVADYTSEPALYGNLVSQNRDEQSHFFHSDALGSTLCLTDDAQQAADTYGYTAFGDVSESTGNSVTPFLYIGRKGYSRDDDNTYAVRRRRLHPWHGRWISADPSEREILESDDAFAPILRLAETYGYWSHSQLHAAPLVAQTNAPLRCAVSFDIGCIGTSPCRTIYSLGTIIMEGYMYVCNNPINVIDPSGLQVEPQEQHATVVCPQTRSPCTTFTYSKNPNGTCPPTSTLVQDSLGTIDIYGNPGVTYRDRCLECAPPESCKSRECHICVSAETTTQRRRIWVRDQRGRWMQVLRTFTVTNRVHRCECTRC